MENDYLMGVGNRIGVRLLSEYFFTLNYVNVSQVQ